MIMRNSTIIGNTGYVETGGVIAGGTSYLNNVTIANNQGVPELDSSNPPQASATGGIYGNQNTFMANSIVAHNRLGPGDSIPDRHDCSGTIVGVGYNLVFDPAGCNLAGDLTGNITGQDPALGPLASDGYSLTYSLSPGSPAINAANPAFPNGIGNACEPADQLFRQRGIGPGVGRCDIGAYERGGAPVQEGAP